MKVVNFVFFGLLARYFGAKPGRAESPKRETVGVVEVELFAHAFTQPNCQSSGAYNTEGNGDIYYNLAFVLLSVLMFLVCRGSVVSVGVMSHTLRVQATEDVYQTTKEKMTLADEEVKKVR